MKRTYKELEKNSKNTKDSTVQTFLDKFLNEKKRIKTEESNNIKTPPSLLSQKTGFFLTSLKI